MDSAGSQGSPPPGIYSMWVPSWSRSVTCLHRLWHKWWNVPPVNRSQTILTSLLLADALSWRLWGYKLPHSQSLCAQVQITSKQGSAAAGPAAHMESNVTENYMNLEAVSSHETPTLAHILIAAWSKAEAEDPAKRCWDFWPQKMWGNKHAFLCCYTVVVTSSYRGR